MSVLVSLFGRLLVLGVTVSGLVVMVAPTWGKELLKNIATGAGLFFLGLILFEMACSALRR